MEKTKTKARDLKEVLLGKARDSVPLPKRGKARSRKPMVID
jgi:hypothetical protein